MARNRQNYLMDFYAFLHEIVEKNAERLYNMDINMKERVHYEAK